MTRKCCILNCHGNYTPAEKVSVFTFPTDDALREKWLQNIAREGWKPTKYSVVCERHFDPLDIKHADLFPCCNGETLLVPRDKPKLTENAVPIVFPVEKIKTVRKNKKSIKETELLTVAPYANEGKAKMQRKKRIENSVAIENAVPTCANEKTMEVPRKTRKLKENAVNTVLPVPCDNIDIVRVTRNKNKLKENSVPIMHQVDDRKLRNGQKHEQYPRKKNKLIENVVPMVLQVKQRKLRNRQK